METSSNKYVCNNCNKTYKNKSGYWKHNKKYHVDTCKSNVIQKDLQMETCVSPFVSPFVSPSAVKISHTNITTNDGYSCDHCGTACIEKAKLFLFTPTALKNKTLFYFLTV